MENKKKSDEQLASEHTGENLLKYILSGTFARHAKLNEKEFLKETGLDKLNKDESQAMLVAMYNLLVEMEVAIVGIDTYINKTIRIFEMSCLDGKTAEQVKGEQNGK